VLKDRKYSEEKNIWHNRSKNERNETTGNSGQQDSSENAGLIKRNTNSLVKIA